MRATIEDIDIVYRIMTDKDVYDSMSDDGCGFDLSKEAIKKILINDKIYVLHPNEFTIFLWMPDNHCTCWVHTAILKEGRGKKAIIAGKKAIRWMFENTKYLKLITWIPSFNKQAELYSKWCGFIKEGCSKKSFLKNGILYDQYLYGLTKEHYICQQRHIL